MPIVDVQCPSKALVVNVLREKQKAINCGKIVEDINDEPREKVNVPLRFEAKTIIENVREQTGVAKTEALTRILEWYAALPVKLRLAILNRDVDTRRELTRLVLSEMAGTEKADPHAAIDAPVTEEQATRIIRIMLDHLERIRAGRQREKAGIEPGSQAAKRRGR
jgi:hypothetical protein